MGLTHLHSLGQFTDQSNESTISEDLQFAILEALERVEDVQALEAAQVSSAVMTIVGEQPGTRLLELGVKVLKLLMEGINSGVTSNCKDSSPAASSADPVILGAVQQIA